jgi:hypothetical protein
MIVSFPVERDRRAFTNKLQPFTFRQDLSDAGKRRANAQRHIQRTAVQFRDGKAQLVIFAAGQRPAQGLLRFDMATDLR